MARDTILTWLNAQHQYKVIGPPAVGITAQYAVGVHTTTTCPTTYTVHTTDIRTAEALQAALQAALHVVLVHGGRRRPPPLPIPLVKSGLSLLFVRPLSHRVLSLIAMTCFSATRGMTGARRPRNCMMRSKLSV